MKKRHILVCIAVFFLILILFSAFAKESKLPKSISDLLAGKNLDVEGVLSDIDDSQLPLALTIYDVLKHKALHKETELTLEAVDRFKTLVEKRIKNSSVVSLKKSPDYPQRIPAQEVEIDGKKIVVPEHFLAPGKFVITDVVPRGEAGTLFPEIVVSFANGKEPVKAKLTIGKKNYPGQLAKDSFVFQPAMTASCAFPIGVHKATIVLVDAENSIASFSWSFSIGEKPFQSPELSKDAKQIKTITVPSSSIVSGSTNYPTVKIIVYKNPDGQLCYEYCLPGKSGAMTKTTGLFLLGKILKAKKSEELLRIKPAAPCMFPDTPLDFSYEYYGPGWVTGSTWAFATLEGTTFSHEASPKYLFKNLVLLVSCQLKVSVLLSEDSSESAKDLITVQHYIRPFQFNFIDDSIKSLLQMRPPKTSTTIQSDRKVVWDLGETIYSAKLVEGSAIQVADQGRLMVVTARWAHAGGTITPTIEFPEKDETTLEFESPGVAEMVHEVVMTFDWSKEHYEWQFKPKFASLIAVLPIEAQALFKKFPPGIIAETKRKVIVKEYSLAINGDQKTFKQPSDLKIAPPWVIAQSQEFPETKPLALSQLTPWFFVKNPDISRLSYKDGFTAEILYDGVLLPENEMPFRIYFPFLFLSKPAIPDLDQFPWLVPCGEWVPIGVYPNPAGLIQVEVSPSSQEIYEGQKFEFKAAIVPKDGLGTGKIDPDGGEIDLLEGYKSQGISNFNWNARLLPEETPWKNGSGLIFAFEPKQGTGTYEIVASTVVEVKEVDTSSLAKVFGAGSATAEVGPGLKILSPIDKFYYPFGFPIKVETSLDKKPDEWKEIKWFLDGKPWLPNPAEPKPNLVLEEPGSYTLKAVYQITPEIELSQEVAFTVKNVVFNVAPARRVMPFSSGLTLSLNGSVVFKDHPPLEDSQKTLNLGDGVTAKVTNVEWLAVSDPKDSVHLKIEDNKLLPKLEFPSSPPTRGFYAATSIGTVTISISKNIWISPKSGKKRIRREEIFTLPAVRSDIWAVSGFKWNPINAEFPKRAIAKAGRTFSVKDGKFTFQGSEYVWTQQTGLQKIVTLPPALPDPEVHSPKGDEIYFAWSGPDDQTSEEFQFTPVFKEPGTFEVTLNSFLSFGADGKVPFPWEKGSIEAVPLDSLIDYFIDPNHFVMTIGDTLTFNFQMKALEAPPEPPTDPPETPAKTEIFLLDNSYKLTLQSVEWANELATESRQLGEFEYPFTPSEIGTFSILATASCWLEEVTAPAKEDGGWPFNKFASSDGVVVNPEIKIFVNEEPLSEGLDSLYLGQKITLSYEILKGGNPVSVPVESQMWDVEEPLPVRYDFKPYTCEKSRLITVSLEDRKKATLSFCIYDFDPTKTEKSGSLIVKIKEGPSLSCPFKIRYKRPISSDNLVIAPDQEVTVIRLPSGEWKIGFPISTPPSAVHAVGEVINPTGQEYALSYFQLVALDQERTVENSGLKDLKPQFKKTIPASANWSDPCQEWLDTEPPGWDWLNNESRIVWIKPGETKPAVFADDSPLYSLEPPLSSANYSTRSFYKVIVVVKPSDLEYDEGIWCPIKVFQWSWGGKTEVDSATSEWAKPESAFLQGLESFNIFIPEWPDHAHPYYKATSGVVFPENPTWRDK